MTRVFTENVTLNDLDTRSFSPSELSQMEYDLFGVSYPGLSLLGRTAQIRAEIVANGVLPSISRVRYLRIRYRRIANGSVVGRTKKSGQVLAGHGEGVILEEWSSSATTSGTLHPDGSYTLI